MGLTFDAKDQAILVERIKTRGAIEGPVTGDFVRFATGEVERLVVRRGVGIQTSPAGSYYLWHGGDGDFTGGLNPPIPEQTLDLTAETMEGQFWFFHHDEVGPGSRVDFTIPCRVYTTSASYAGFLGAGTRCPVCG